MEELEAFSDASFSASSFVNDALKRKPVDETSEAHLAGLSMKLHIISKEYTDQLETGMVDAMSAMPRVLNEVARIEDILKSVNREMAELAGQLRSFDQRNVQGVGDLSRLDTLKTNMEVCKATLEEHARWNQLVREAKAFLESGGRLADSADRIANMRKSLSILVHTPGHDSRLATCAQLSDALLAAVKPKLLTAMSAAQLDIAAMREYQHVYVKLDRGKELLDEYLSTRPAQLCSMWLDYSPMTTSYESFTVFFESFLKGLLQLANTEQANTRELFSASATASGTVASTSSSSGNIKAAVSDEDATSALVCSMLVNALESSLTTNLSERMRETMSPDDVLVVYNALNSFAMDAINAIFDNKKERSDSVSSELSIDMKAKSQSLADLAPLLLNSLFAPFLNNQDVVFYSEGVVLRSLLADALAGVSFSSHSSPNPPIGTRVEQFEDATGLGLSEEDMSGSGSMMNANNGNDPAQACTAFSWQLVQANGKLSRPCTALLTRCAHVLGGLHFAEAVNTCATSLSQYLQQMTQKVADLRVRCSLQPIGSGAGATDALLKQVARAEYREAEQWVRGIEEAGLTPPSRDLMPASLRAMQAAGRAYIEVEHIQDCIKTTVESTLKNLTVALSDDSAVDTLLEGVLAGNGTGSATDVGLHYVCYQHQMNPLRGREARLALEKMLKQNPLESVLNSLTALTSLATGTFLEICTSIPERALFSLWEDDVWTEVTSEYDIQDAAFDEIKIRQDQASAADTNEDDGEGGDDGNENVGKPKRVFLYVDENMLPQSSVTLCGEHLLSLVQELEMFAASDALADLLGLRGGIMGAGEGAAARGLGIGWGQGEASTSSSSFTPELLSRLYRRKAAASTVKSAEQALFGDVRSEISEEAAADISEGLASGTEWAKLDDEEAGNAFVNECLQAVCDAVIGLLLTQVVQVRSFSHKGRAQLAVDLDYLSNVIHAMGLTVHPVASHLRSLLDEHPAALLASMESQAARGITGIALHKFGLCIASASAAVSPAVIADN